MGAFLREYIQDYKPRLIDGRRDFFEYQFPEKRIDNVWVEKEACSFVRDATDDLLGRLAPAESVYYLVDGLRSFGGAATAVEDMEALEVFANTFVEMGTTERTFGVSVNFNTRPPGTFGGRRSLGPGERPRGGREAAVRGLLRTVRPPLLPYS